jgi:competence ComEA-like helix-hairpin-helix protein
MRLVTIFFALALGSASAQTTPPPPGPPAMPAGAGKAIVQEKCVVCHALSVVTSKHASHKEWDQVVNQMVSRGADLTDEEIDTVIEYLSKNYGPLDQTATPSASSGDQPASTATADTSSSEASVNVNKASAEDLESSLGLAKPEAEAIVKYREQKGNFKTWQEVAAVPGVPASKIEGLQKRITFE